MTERCLRVWLPALPKALAGLRRSVRERFGEPCDDIELCVTELVGDVIRHVGEGTWVRVVRADGGTRIEVTDPDPRALPVLLRASEEDESGRGLALLDAVASRWGVRQGAEGKTVWCELGGRGAKGGRCALGPGNR
ncbi:ATP-binding protein [Streptomyces sp. NPDC006134]|uniref:ATP-binding protein n=1 Tax=Streptomyces sp. NPDC006134 TaxID=3154467 RepID=UPI00340E275B